MMENSQKTNEWWGKRRKRYNISLISAGILAFISYATIISVFRRYFNQAEITLFTTTVQGIGYLIMLAIANICYYIGPISERLSRPKNIVLYRKVAYSLGYWFSMALPFSIPGFLLYMVLIKHGIDGKP
jgi:hypothetical protein